MITVDPEQVKVGELYADKSFDSISFWRIDTVNTHWEADRQIEFNTWDITSIAATDHRALSGKHTMKRYFHAGDNPYAFGPLSEREAIKLSFEEPSPR